MPKEKNLKRIVWAVDPFGTSADLQSRIARTLGGLTRQLNVEIEPVYVLAHCNVQVPVREFPNSRLTITGGPSVREVESPEQALRVWAQSVKDLKLSEPKCLESENHSIRSSVERLLDYAKETHTDLIALSTRAREGFARLLMGSFAETLALQSPISLLLVNPLSALVERFDEVLFPSDLSVQSKQAFEKVLSFASRIGASVTLFHKLQFIGEGDFEKDVERMAMAETELKRWKEIATYSKVRCETVLDKKPGNIAESLLKYAEGKHSLLIAMFSESGPIATSLLGSVTRQVIRCAACPVWVTRLGPHG